MAGPQEILVLGFACVFGACVGSFLNVVAYRLPRECMSIVRPRSRCPRCSSPIPWHANLPVVSYLILGGRCKSCRASISPRYPLVEVGTGALFLLVILTILPSEGRASPVDHGEAWLACGVALLITAVLIVLSLVDLDFRILPDELTKSGIVLGPILVWLAPSLQPSPVIDDWFPAGTGASWIAGAHGILGCLSGMTTLWLIGWAGTKVFKKPAMGLGDVKMIGAMGGVLGFWVFLALAVAAVGGAVVGILLRLLAGVRYIPFGPFLAAGMWTVMLWGEEILRFYLNLFR